MTSESSKLSRLHPRLGHAPLLGVVLLLACIGFYYLRPSPLRAVDPAQAGLLWRECPRTQDFWQQAQDCFGHPMPLWGKDETAIRSQRIDSENFRLDVGSDSYWTQVRSMPFGARPYTLYKNGWPIKTLWGEVTAHSPNISLQSRAGIVIWEFADRRSATIFVDGRDLRSQYRLDNAYRPYILAGKLIFIGQVKSKYFVVYDELKIGPDFDQILIAYCCEAVLYSVQAGQGRYLFQGQRRGQWYVVELTALSE